MEKKKVLLNVILLEMNYKEWQFHKLIVANEEKGKERRERVNVTRTEERGRIGILG